MLCNVLFQKNAKERSGASSSLFHYYQTRPRNYKHVMLLCSQTKGCVNVGVAASIVDDSVTLRKYRVQDRMLINDICTLVIVKDTERHGPQNIYLPSTASALLRARMY